MGKKWTGIRALEEVKAVPTGFGERIWAVDATDKEEPCAATLDTHVESSVYVNFPIDSSCDEISIGRDLGNASTTRRGASGRNLHCCRISAVV